jgi:sec-independent protein translocase protein TatC
MSKRSKMTDPRMPLTGHLEELRSRLLKALGAVGVGMLLTYSFSDQVITFLKHPGLPELYSLSPTEAFWTTLKVTFFSGLLLALPVVLFQLWRFISPGLLPGERRYALPFVVLAYLFFLLGVLFCYAVVLPFALKFLVGFGLERGIKPLFSMGLYVDFVLKFLLAFGLIFELPLAITLLSRMGWLTPEFLTRNRRYALLLNAVFAAILTPTSDVFNMALTLLPLMLFYELGILGARIFGRKAPPETDAVVREAETEA